MKAFLRRRWFSLLIAFWLGALAFCGYAGLGYQRLPYWVGFGVMSGTLFFEYRPVASGPPMSGLEDGLHFEEFEMSAAPMFGILWPPIGKSSYDGIPGWYVVVQTWVLWMLLAMWIAYAELALSRKRRAAGDHKL